MSNLNELIRENIRSLDPYSSARMESSLAMGLFLDANENPYGEYNRYPDPLQQTLRRRLAELKDIAASQVFIGNGSDELIDLVFRIFCEPDQDEALTFSPTYGMYAVAARINAVTLHEIPLTDSFELDLEALKPRLENPNLKLILLCSPNNPSGNRIPADQIRWLLEHFKGILLLDEAYIDFCPEFSMLSELSTHPRLIISQTLSKAWGMAGLRLGLGFASEALIQWLDKVKPPYNVSSLNQEAALASLMQPERMQKQVAEIRQERVQLALALSRLSAVRKVYPSDANFLLIKVDDAPYMYAELIKRGIVIRSRHAVLPGCLRITIGSPVENQQLLTALTEICHA